MGGEVFWGRLGLFGKDLRWNPSTACGGPPPLSGEAFEGGDVLGMEWRFAWKGGPLHRLAAVPLPYRGGFWEWEGLGVEVGVDWKVGTSPPPGGGPPRTERSPLSLRDISPPRGESPLEGRLLGVGRFGG